MDNKKENAISCVNDLIVRCNKGESLSIIEKELTFLIIDLFGNNSKEYEEFDKIKTFYIFRKYEAYIGLLRAIKNHIQIYGLNKDNESFFNHIFILK